ncbi:RseC/MucC-like positive regulator of sigma(E) [Vreelandella songnenensis]|uniref:RseC/MucC-like positive regulator of sigma(E) n=1 Tax=Vreelandella songnenensis TaxID=1176243 RepID=A0A2T0V779_9GAMM|nr:SoxR reducing system RseC family protein [Halomonas songnenensis]PRY66045.1 RseC/MucC-like positive regulator of sigma(E) [Halomonas songnenensis]
MSRTLPSDDISHMPGCGALTRSGRVVGYAARGLLVDVSVREACQQCAKGQGCGMGVLARRSHQRIEVAVPCAADQLAKRYPVGEHVTLTLERADITRLALLIYALPLLLALLLSGGVAALDMADWVAPVSFFVSLLAGMTGLRCLLSGRTERFRPRLVS